MTIEQFIRRNMPTYEHVNFSLPFDVAQRAFDKNFVITDYHQTEDKLYLLSEGIVQISTMKEADEKILEFAFPGEFFCAYTSFLLQHPSDVQVTTLTPCKVSVINRDDLYRESQVSLLASHLSLHVAQQLFLSRARREKDFLTLSAEERYRRLLEKDPEIVQLIPGNKVAKYLGVQAESLSRIRRSITP